MDMRLASVATRIEASVLQFFSPNGLLIVVGMIILGMILFSGSGIERRTFDQSAMGQHQRTDVSPLLGTP